MKKQPPEDNNPANPLFKVAALTIDKEYISTKHEHKINISLSLNFKKSDDLRGVTQSKKNNSINVSFTMSIARATLELNCTDDIGNEITNVKMKNIAHITSAAEKNKVKENKIYAADANKKRVVRGKSGVDASLKGPSASVNFDASLSTIHKDNIKTRKTIKKAMNMPMSLQPTLKIRYIGR